MLQKLERKQIKNIVAVFTHTKANMTRLQLANGSET